jgi:hypothetical protein
MHIGPINSEGNEVSVVEGCTESERPGEEDNAMREILEALLDSLKQCRVAIGLCGKEMKRSE